MPKRHQTKSPEAPQVFIMTEKTNINIPAIDAALAAAKARKGKRAAANGENTTATSEASTKAKRTRLTDEERSARNAQKEADRAARKAKRAEERDARRAQRAATRAPAHLAKVEKAGNKLPTLNDEAQAQFNAITAGFSRDQVNAIAQHLMHFNRVQATKRALEQKLEAGARVRVVDGDPRYVGKTGTVSKAQRIRCYVEIEGAKKPVYLFTSDVEVVEAAEATGTEG